MPISIITDSSESDTEFEYFHDDYSSWEDTDCESVFEPEETSPTKYNIILCELFNNKLHGNPENDETNLHYLVKTRFKNLNINFINDLCFRYNLDYYIYAVINSNKLNHNRIRNYKNIVNKENYIKPEIAHCIYLPSQECIAILKTFWIRLIQRKWKNILSERKKILEKRSNIIAIIYREIYGAWPGSCLHYPTLTGMLSNIKY
jgi:hypothetical protein